MKGGKMTMERRSPLGDVKNRAPSLPPQLPPPPTQQYHNQPHHHQQHQQHRRVVTSEYDVAAFSNDTKGKDSAEGETVNDENYDGTDDVKQYR